MIAGFQGEGGAFSEQAVRSFLGEIETRGFATFEETVAALCAGEIDAAVLPHHNVVHGPIETVRALVAGNERLRIAGELEMPIVQCLIVMPGAALEDVRSVASHPVALAQCSRFLRQHPQWSTSHSHDTAGAVREMMERADPASAAIGPAAAAKRYSARLLIRGIQDDERNTTSFWLVVRSN